MSIVTYTTAHVRFTPRNGYQTTDYSERTVIEIRQTEFPDFYVRALDRQNNNKIIFDVKLKNRQTYQMRESANEPDELNTADGRYEIRLASSGREQFHRSLTEILEMIDEIPPSQPRPPSPLLSPVKVRPNPSINSKNVLLTLRELEKAIQNGNERVAIDAVQTLVNQRVKISASEPRNDGNDRPISVNVRIVRMRQNDDGEEFPLEVFHHTTVAELRLALSHLKGIEPQQCYVFVNGQMAHENYTMQKLHVLDRTLFVVLSIA